MMKQRMVPALFLTVALCSFGTLNFVSPMAKAEDLENLLSQGVTSKGTRSNSVMADILKGLLRTPTSEQNHLLRLLEESKWTEALIQWKPAFSQTAMSRQDDFRAYKALLMFKNSMTVTGLEELFLVKEPRKIHMQILNQWREVAGPTHPVWQVAKIEWKGAWTEIFGVNIEVRVKSADQSLPHDQQGLMQLAKLAPADSRERAILDWNLALQYGQKDDTKKAAVIVSSLMKAKNNPIPEDLLHMTAGRLLYQNGYFEAAQKYYDKIPKGSDYFPEAQEEKAWSFLKRGQPNDAVAVTQTLVHQSFSGQVGPETWFVRALGQLKVCDYAAALETLKGFPGEFKERAIVLAKTSKQSETPEVAQAFEQMKDGRLTLAEMAKISKFLPRTMARDEKLRQMIKARSILLEESKSAAQTSASSNVSGVQGEFEIIKNTADQRAARMTAQAVSRVQMLAAQELKEIKTILNKLHIVEAEVIQRVESTTKLSQAAANEIRQGKTGSQAQDVLQFPSGSEIWMDELTNYKVDIKKGCQARRAQ